MADWGFNIYLFSGSSSTPTEITNDVISLPLFTDTGSGEVNQAQIVLNAINGQYISENINGKPIINQYDRIKISVSDGLPMLSGLGTPGTMRGVYLKYFYVMKKQPIKSKDSGVRLQLELLGTESFLQRVQYVKPHYFESPYDVFVSIGNQYNENRGTSSNMPTISGHDGVNNKLPKWIENIYDFGVNEDTCFDRMSDVIDSMGGSLDAGGAFDFFDLKFNYENNGLTIYPHVFSSGNVDYTTPSKPGGTYNIVTISNSTSVNVGETDGGINAQTGTQVLAWGATESGSLPTDFSKFWARQQLWNIFFPDWSSDVIYIIDSKVSHVVNDVRNNYISNANNNTTTPGANGASWVLLTPKSYYGDVKQYSPWTAGKSNSIWKNGSANPNLQYGLNDSGRHYFWDHNLTINNGIFWRTTADVKSTSDEIDLSENGSYHGSKIPHQYCYDTNEDGVGDAFYRGLRVFCSGNPTLNNSKYFGYSSNSAASAVDTNGKKIANSILQYNFIYIDSDSDGKKDKWILGWRVIARPFVDQFTDNTTPIALQCTVMDEAKTYQYITLAASGGNPGSSSWTSITDLDNGNDSFHPVVYENNVHKITNVPGVLANYADNKKDPNITVKDVNSPDGPYGINYWNSINANSAVEVVYDWAPANVAVMDLLKADRDTEDFYQVGAYIGIRFPLPITTYNSINEEVGDIYGGGTNTSNPKEPTTVDIQNMNYTHDGRGGFNNNSSEDLGQINAISFNIKLKYQQQYIISQALSLVIGDQGANFKMRCALWDTDDNCVIQDFTIFFNDTFQSVSLPIGGFQVFKSNAPLYGSTAEHYFVQPKGIDIQNIFIWRNLKAISIYTLDQYDEAGRYTPNISTLCSGISDIRRRMTLTLDAFRFQKPLLVSTGVLTTDVIQPDFIERPEISNYETLRNDAIAEQQKHKFKKVDFDVTTTGIFDIGFGDYFNLTDEDIIPSDLQEPPFSNTIKLVAKRIEYSISKPLNGKGGFLRRIRGVKRFV